MVMAQPFMQMQPVILVPIQLPGMERLGMLDSIYVKQKFDLMEAMSGCEVENSYSVFQTYKDGEAKGKPIFKCKEKSGCCSRTFLSGACRPFDMKVKDEGTDEEFLTFNRPCTCAFLCCNRPNLKVFHKGAHLGSIVQPFMWCNLQVNVFDAFDQLRFKIEGSCNQLGLWCKCPCEPCEKIDFIVHDALGNKTGFLQKKSPGCAKAMISDADNFALQFPKDATKEDKALLLAAVIMLDFMYFEENPKNNRNHHH
jgi:hypothetical protein